MSSLQVINTLPHLIPVHCKQANLHAYATITLPAVQKYLVGLKVWTPDKIFFQYLKSDLEAGVGFNRVERVSQSGEYTIKGDLITFWPLGYSQAIQAEFFDDECEGIFSFDAALNRRVERLKYYLVNFVDIVDAEDSKYLHIFPSSEPKGSPLNLALFTNQKVSEQPGIRYEYVNYDYQFPQLFWQRMDLMAHEVDRYLDAGFQVKLITKHVEEIPLELIEKTLASRSEAASDVLEFIDKDISAGLLSNQEKVLVLTDREIFGTIYLTQRKAGSTNSEKLLRQLEGEIEVGDYVVHEDYGICVYAGLTQEEISRQTREYLQLKFAGDDELLIPVEQVHKLTKYIGNDGLSPKLSKLSGGTWGSEQQKLRKTVAIKAKELVEHYARRELATAKVISDEDSPDYESFLGDFPYQATKDQLRATNEIIHDLTSATPMNRLLVGDVGFGKTEVAMRAAFKVIESGLQVAVLCPTTVLCSQHEEVFKHRFANTGFRVEAISRFNSAKQNRDLIDAANKGEIDILIGTHRLLSKDVKFKKLGLLVVDEEQRFGVAQKEKIKQINYGTHFLSISATPIPRTLSMALTAIQDISIITEAPANRKPVVTELAREWQDIISAITRETSRQGQVYFVHNRVNSVQAIKAKLEQLVPGLRVVVGHGQMSPATLDQAMTSFYKHEYDVLLATTIIENGLDIPNVNTMIINHADHFGLSQLYQLRGRVGRANRQAYCYLLTSRTLNDNPDYDEHMTPEAKAQRKKSLERLEAIVKSDQLGSGFSVASKDLEIRGAGDILGEKQSGHITKVGYALYMQLLAQEIDRLRSAADLLKRNPEYLTI